MVRSGVLASAGYGLLFGACAEFVAALTCWLLDVRAVWLPLSVGLGVALVAGFVTFLSGFARMTAGLPIAWTAWDWRNGRSR